ncbi:acyltransferase [Labedella populi]|uniref:Acyltransferase n=1 Tax=Labedella populi TaxID=2498850 RepID=A0A3S4CFB0_9MICO|nr:acyltransferase [Labedella populi]RWZ68645.1 acyltransferase [Labedella populi]
MQGRIAGLDLLRGLAIGLVLLRHAWPGTFGSAGIVGVVAFFALSGYLITGILLADLAKRGRVDFVRFFRNRAIRLFPPLLLVLAAIALVTLTVDPLGQRDGLARALLIGLTYTGNLPIELGSSAIDHLWTLATEEQFYLVWPLLLTLAVRRRRPGFVVLAVVAALLLVLTITLVGAAPDVQEVYRYPASWSLALVIGAAARIWSDRVVGWMPVSHAARALVGGVAVATLLALSFLPGGKYEATSYLILGPFVALVTVVLIHVWRDWGELPTPALRPLLALGTISYAAYLWNYPIVLWLGAVLGRSAAAGWLPLAGIVATIAAATVSWWLVEVPSRRWRRRLDARAATAQVQGRVTSPVG